MLRDIATEHGLNIVVQPFAPVDYALNGLKNGKRRTDKRKRGGGAATP